MCIQDPPVALGPSVTQGHMFDTSLYRAYTQTGPYIDYEVWPPLYLCEGGSLLTKGVAQGSTTNGLSSETIPKLVI